MQRVEPGEVDIASIHHVKAASLERNLIEDIDIVQFAVGNMDKGRNVAPQIEQGVKLHGSLLFAKARPWKERQAQIDGGGIERINGMRQFQTEAVPGVKLARCLDQAEGKVLIDAPVAVFVGVGQCAFGNAATDAQMIQLGRMRAQAGFTHIALVIITGSNTL